MEKSFDTPREKAIKILTQTKQWILSVVTYRFSLKPGEKVWVCVFTKQPNMYFHWKVVKQATIKGFYVYGIAYKDHPYINWHHYSNGLFYGFGYPDENYVIVLKHKWLLPFARVAEKIRLFKW
jgi:hypothetical protein